MKNNQEFLEELKVEVDKLQKLLEDNQVGLFTWWSFLVDRLNKINEISKKLGIVDEIRKITE